MSDQPDLRVPRLPLPLFTLDPSQSGGRKSRTGFEFQDQYVACVLAEFFAGTENFFAARVEGVEDLEAIIRAEGGWVERYYQVKSRQEGGAHWTIAALEKEGVWTRFFSLYRRFGEQKFEVGRALELVIAVEGDLARELIELREKGRNATTAKAKLMSALSSAIASEASGSATSEAIVSVLIDGFISSLRFESRVTNLQEITVNRLIESGDLSPDEAQSAGQRLLASIRAESLLTKPTLITFQVLNDWLGIPQRAFLQKRAMPEPYEVDREDLLARVAAQLEERKVLLLHGVPKVGKSHLVSRLIERAGMDNDYFWFTSSGDEGDKDRFLYQLASWVGQRTSVWQVRDDVQRGRLQPHQALDRLKKIAVGPMYLVVDDCHKLKDAAFLEQVTNLVMQGWLTAKILLISEEKLPELRVLAIQEMSVTGFEPKEGIIFLIKLGLDVRDALTELGMLCVQADGHPVLLRAIASELPPRPSAADVTNLSATLLSALSVQPFLQVLSQRLIRSLRTASQRLWLTRLAVLAFAFKRSLALEIAQLEPRIDVAAVDWIYLASQILDQSGADQYVVPPLLRPLLTSEGQEPDRKAILLASARHVFRNASASRHIDFWDFQGAVLALVLAERYEEAAMRFTLSLASSLEVGPLSVFEILFMVLNGDMVQAKLKDPLARFLLLLVEIQMRLQNEAAPNYSRILGLLRRIRTLPKAELTANAFLHMRMTVHAVISTVHIRRIKDGGSYSVRDGRRAFAPLQTALRLAVGQKDVDFVSFVLGLYGHVYSLEKEPDLELLKEAILSSPATISSISGDALAGIYTQFVISKKYGDSALELCERHSREYRAAGRGDAFLACEHAIATILHDRFSRYKDARERVTLASQQAVALGASSDAVARAELLVADSYWAEKQYASSEEHYRQVLSSNFDDEALNQWVRERLADSLIFLGRLQEASSHLLNSIRKHAATLSAENKARLYARLAYLYGLHGDLRKAAIACQSVCRIARKSRSAEIDVMSATLCDWLLQYFQYSDPVIPKSSVQIRDSSVLSEKPTAGQLSTWNSRGPLFARALILLGMLFELLEDMVRAEFTYRKALGIFQAARQANPGSGEGLFFALRICRVQVKRRFFAAASLSFASAVEVLLAAKRTETPAATPGAAAFAAFTFLEPVLASLPDSELVEFSVAMENQFRGMPDVRAWVLYRECELFFDRLLVQKAKPKLLEAEDLAAVSGERELLSLVRYKKLFARFEQMYSSQVDWLRDVLEEGLRLADDDKLASNRDGFGKNVFGITKRSLTGPMREVGLRVSGFGERWHQNPFVFSLLAVWAASRQNRLRIGVLAQVESYLRKVGDPVKDEDFA